MANGSGMACGILTCEWPSLVSEMGPANVNPLKPLGAVLESGEFIIPGIDSVHHAAADTRP